LVPSSTVNAATARGDGACDSLLVEDNVPSRIKTDSDQASVPERQSGEGGLVSRADDEHNSRETGQVVSSSQQNSAPTTQLQVPTSQALPIDSAVVSDGDDELSSAGDLITTRLAMALIELQRYMDFEECRDARANNQEIGVSWDDAGCRAAVLTLVLVIEAALTHGRCLYKPKTPHEDADAYSNESGADVVEEEAEHVFNESERPVEVTLPEYESATLTQILMELTSDIDAFEERVAAENTLMQESTDGENKFDDMIAEAYKPTATEQSTLRTLIAAWLHTGQIYRTVALLVRAHATVLLPYYHETAFLRTPENANGFVRQLRSLDGVECMVDTMTVLASPRLDETSNDELAALVKRSVTSSGASPSLQQEEHPQPEALPGTSILSAQFSATSATPRYLDFHRNESFAASLRSERERRMSSWERILDEDVADGLPVICHGSEDHVATHKELHHLARIFYAGTNMIALRDAARRKSVEGEASQSAEEPAVEEDVHVSLMTVETACSRRRIEVPDDDSSFLLRAQVSDLAEYLFTHRARSLTLCFFSFSLIGATSQRRGRSS